MTPLSVHPAVAARSLGHPRPGADGTGLTTDEEGTLVLVFFTVVSFTMFKNLLKGTTGKTGEYQGRQTPDSDRAV